MNEYLELSLTSRVFINWLPRSHMTSNNNTGQRKGWLAQKAFEDDITKSMTSVHFYPRTMTDDYRCFALLVYKSINLNA